MHRTAVEYAGGQKENAPVTVVVTVVVVWESLVGGYMGETGGGLYGREGELYERETGWSYM